MLCHIRREECLLTCLCRCLPLLREHSKRDELLEMSIDAGDSARARGAHEVSAAPYVKWFDGIQHPL